MLTPPQLGLWQRAWRRVEDANAWRMARGRLVPEAAATRDSSFYHQLVWRGAAAAAAQEHRGVTATDLRRACYLAATTRVPGPEPGRFLPWHPCSRREQLGNREFSRVLVLWDLLVDPNDLGAVVKWDHPEISERESLLKTLPKRAPDATLRAICANAFGTRQWENLESGQLRWLSGAIGRKQRAWPRERAAGQRAAGVPPAERAQEQEDPF